jgi:hypothetical protein
MPINKNQSPKTIIESLLGNVEGVEDSVVEEMVELFESISVKTDEDSALIEHLQKENEQLEKTIESLESIQDGHLYEAGLVESLINKTEAEFKKICFIKQFNEVIEFFKL